MRGNTEIFNAPPRDITGLGATLVAWDTDSDFFCYATLDDFPQWAAPFLIEKHRDRYEKIEIVIGDSRHTCIFPFVRKAEKP